MLPPLPDFHAIAVLLLIGVALYLFTRERLPLETSCLLILIVLVIGFYLFPYQRGGVVLHPIDFFRGFGNEALVTICALMILGAGLETTGALRPMASVLARLWSTRPLLSLLLTLICAAVLSAFLNNTPIVVMLLPILIGVSLRSGIVASSILLPMGMATLVGGMATTIGTSTNLLVVSVAAHLGLPRFAMFDFALPVLLAGSVAMLYLWLLAPRLIPERKPLLESTSPRIFEALVYIHADSVANGKSLADIRQMTGGSVRIESVERGEGLVLARLPTLTFRPGDRLRVRDTPENLKEFERQLGATLHNIDDPEHPISDEHPLLAEGQQLAEVVVTAHSPLHNRTLREERFAEQNNLVILALHRPQAHRAVNGDLGDVRLMSGDVLLLQGAAERIAELRASGKLLVLDATVDLPETRRTKLALSIMVAVVAMAALGVLPIALSALCGVTVMLLSRCLDWQDAVAALSTQVVLIVVVSLALGLALTVTGGAAYLAQLYVALSAGLPPLVVLSGLMLVMAVLTNIVSNNAAAVIGTPIAVGIAQQLGVAVEPFVLAVLFGANMSYATPMGYQTNLLIFSAGGYVFSDFLRVGLPLTLIMWLTLSLLLGTMYGL